MSDNFRIGRIEFAPGYRSKPVPLTRGERGLGAIDCANCERSILCLIGSPPKPWRWTADGWVCGECDEP